MRRLTWRDWAARAAVTVGALSPYLPLLTLNRIYVTDDGFASDIFNGELPSRVLVGQLVAAGQAPVWTSSLCSGIPVVGIMEPLSLGLFSALPAAPALCLLVIAFVLVAAHGAYALARRLGAERVGAVLAGIAYAGSGYMVTQLKHLAIISTVVWLPWGLLLLDRALATNPTPPFDRSDSGATVPSTLTRLRDIGLFGLVYAEQVASGFPQSAYISGLVYGTWALVLLIRLRGSVGRLPLRMVLGSALGIAVVLAAMCGAATLLPLSELGSTSDRQGRSSWEFASVLPYSWSDTLNFLIPYANGDVADGTYHADGLFWENYGYVGAATLVLAVWAVVRGFRRPRVWLLFGLLIGAFAMVLGPRTPVYYLAWKYLPGMGVFRFPTRFLIVVDLTISVLGAIGLGLLRPDLQRLLARAAPRIPRMLPPAIVLGTALDLFAHQTHQNPFVPASEWLRAPTIVAALRESARSARLFSPLHNYFHRLAYRTARGWSDLNPYRELRETVAPNTGVYWGISTADCYFGIAPTWYVDVWGDHSRNGLVVTALMRIGRAGIVPNTTFSTVLASYGVTHLASPLQIHGMEKWEIPIAAPVYVYELPGKRARVVPQARTVHSNSEAAAVLVRPGFDPDQELLLHGSANVASPSPGDSVHPSDVRGEASVVAEDSQNLRLRVVAPHGGYLLLADTYYPGWRVTVDGTSATLHRANISLRAVQLPPGAKFVDFHYEAGPFFKGLRIACAGVLLLLVWLAGTSYFGWKLRSKCSTHRIR